MTTVNEHSGIVSATSDAAVLVEGAWTELIASVAQNTTFALFFVAPQATHHNDHYMDVAIGGAGSEVALLNDFYLGCSTNGGDFNDVYFAFSLPLKFTLGDRISVRFKDGLGAPITYRVSIRIFE